MGIYTPRCGERENIQLGEYLYAPLCRGVYIRPAVKRKWIEKYYKAKLCRKHVIVWSLFIFSVDANESSNMYFAFRWLLILFKREFVMDDVMRLWEVRCYTLAPPSPLPSLCPCVIPPHSSLCVHRLN